MPTIWLSYVNINNLRYQSTINNYFGKQRLLLNFQKTKSVVFIWPPVIKNLQLEVVLSDISIPNILVLLWTLLQLLRQILNTLPIQVVYYQFSMKPSKYLFKVRHCFLLTRLRPRRQKRYSTKRCASVLSNYGPTDPEEENNYLLFKSDPKFVIQSGKVETG